MKFGKNTSRYLLSGLQGGPMGLLAAADSLQRERKTHSRRKELKRTPTTTNINTSPNVTHLSYNSGASHGARNFNRDPWRNEEDGSV